MSDSGKGLTRRGFLKVAAATSVPLLLAACAPQAAAPAGEEGAAAVPSGEKVTVRYIAMDYDSRMAPDTQAVIDEFNASQGDIEADLEVISWGNGKNVILTQISAGQAPDLFNGGGGWLLEFELVDELAPLGDLMDAALLDQFWSSGIEAMTVDGQLYGMPYFLDPRGFYYRPDLFEEAGLEAPETWADVREAALAVHNPPEVFGIGTGIAGPTGELDYWWYAWVGAIGGGNNLSRWGENGRSLVADEVGLAAAQFMADLVLTDQTAQPSPVNADRDGDLQPLFLGGQLAMLETGSWLPTIMLNDAPDVPFASAPLPVAEEGMAHANAFWPDCVMMSSQSEHQEEAAALLTSMFGFDNRLAWALQRGVIPERIDVGQDPRYLDPENPVTPYNEIFVEELVNAHNVFETPWPATSQQDDVTIEDGIAKVWLGEASVEEAMQEAAQIIDERHGV